MPNDDSRISASPKPAAEPYMMSIWPKRWDDNEPSPAESRAEYSMPKGREGELEAHNVGELLLYITNPASVSPMVLNQGPGAGPLPIPPTSDWAMWGTGARRATFALHWDKPTVEKLFRGWVEVFDARWKVGSFWKVPKDDVLGAPLWLPDTITFAAPGAQPGPDSPAAYADWPHKVREGHSGPATPTKDIYVGRVIESSIRFDRDIDRVCWAVLGETGRAVAMWMTVWGMYTFMRGTLDAWDRGAPPHPA